MGENKKRIRLKGLARWKLIALLETINWLRDILKEKNSGPAMIICPERLMDAQKILGN